MSRVRTKSALIAIAATVMLLDLPSASATEAIQQTTTDTNCRSGPSVTYDVVTKYPKATQVILIDYSTGYSKELNSSVVWGKTTDECWVRKDLLASTPDDRSHMARFNKTYTIENGNSISDRLELAKQLIDEVGLEIYDRYPTDVEILELLESVSLDATSRTEVNIYYPNCAAARTNGATPIHRGEPGYRSALDRDNDGLACE